MLVPISSDSRHMHGQTSRFCLTKVPEGARRGFWAETQDTISVTTKTEFRVEAETNLALLINSPANSNRLQTRLQAAVAVSNGIRDIVHTSSKAKEIRRQSRRPNPRNPHLHPLPHPHPRPHLLHLRPLPSPDQQTAGHSENAAPWCMLPDRS